MVLVRLLRRRFSSAVKMRRAKHFPSALRFEEDTQAMTETSTEYALEGAASTAPTTHAQDAVGYASSATRQVIEMAEVGPLPLRVLAFLGGVGMIVASILDAVKGLVHVDLIHITISIYICLFGGIVCILEGPNFLPPFAATIQTSLHSQARFLRFRWGRGLFFFFAGSLQFSHWSFTNSFFGGYMMTLGIVSGLTGWRAAKKLGDLRTSFPDEDALQRQFTAYDAVNGFLQMDDFVNMCQAQGLYFDQNESEAAFAAIDRDHDGQISWEDFKGWYHAGEDEGVIYAQV